MTNLKLACRNLEDAPLMKFSWNYILMLIQQFPNTGHMMHGKPKFQIPAAIGFDKQTWLGGEYGRGSPEEHLCKSFMNWWRHSEMVLFIITMPTTHNQHATSSKLTLNTSCSCELTNIVTVVFTYRCHVCILSIKHKHINCNLLSRTIQGKLLVEICSWTQTRNVLWNE